MHEVNIDVCAKSEVLADFSVQRPSHTFQWHYNVHNADNPATLMLVQDTQGFGNLSHPLA